MFAVTLKQVTILLLYILIGYLLTLKKIIDKNASKVLAKLLMWVFSPFYMIINLSQNVTVEKIKLYFTLFVSGTVLMMAAIFVAILLAKLLCKKGYQRNVYIYLLAFANNGYFGYPLIQAVFGGEMLAHFMIFCLSVNVGIYTFGYSVLTDDTEENIENVADGGTCSKKKKMNLSFLYSPPMLGLYIGIALGLLPIEVPRIVYDCLSPAANCMSASAMILVGCVLAGVPAAKLLSSPKPYVLSVFRLLLPPVIFGAIGYFCYKVCGLSEEIFIYSTVLSCLPAGMNAVVFPESVGKDGTEGAIACFISYVLCLVTIPAVMATVNLLL